MKIGSIMDVILSGVHFDEGEMNGVEGSLGEYQRSFDSAYFRFAKICSAQDDVVRKFLFILLVLFLAGCTNTTDPPAPAASGETLMGTAQAYACSTPTQLSPAGILVSIQGTSLKAITDTGGHFTIDNIPTGVYNIIFSKAGFDSMVYPVHHIIGVGTDIINDAYLVQESTDTISMTGVSWVFNVSVKKIVTVIDTTITDSLGKLDTNVTTRDSLEILYDTAGSSNGMILSGTVTGTLAPGNIYVYTSLDSELFPTAQSPQSSGMSEDAWLATMVNDTAYHFGFQVPRIIAEAFKDTLTRDVATLAPYSLPSGEAVYVYAVGHSNMAGLPSTSGEYQHFSTTPYGPQAVRFKYIVP